MKKKNKIRIVTEYIDWLNSFDELETQAAVVGYSYESPLGESVGKLMDITTNAISKLIEDNGGWLEWYILENERGKGSKEAGFAGNTRPIKTVEDLIQLIEEIETDK